MKLSIQERGRAAIKEWQYQIACALEGRITRAGDAVVAVLEAALAASAAAARCEDCPERCTNPLRSEITCDMLVRENDALRAAARPASREKIAKAIHAKMESELGGFSWDDEDAQQVYYSAADAVLALERSPQPTLSDEMIENEAQRVFLEAAHASGFPGALAYMAKWARDVLSGKVKP